MACIAQAIFNSQAHCGEQLYDARLRCRENNFFSLRHLIDIVMAITHVWSGAWRDGRRGRFALGNDAECGSSAGLKAARLFQTVAVGSTAGGLADDQFGLDDGFGAAGVWSGPGGGGPES